MTRGTAAGNQVAGKNVDAVITGHIGRKAADILIHAGVRIFLGASGTVQSALDAFKSGQLEEKMAQGGWPMDR
ncbi:MAG TPA: NifB/NifX family molybdenum-iron cluster-binding protein [Syntrophales bacterium]|nr:NifB/NifX family molybdenum-iron cluster-binding protein [Syntrophales bacterium]